MDFSEPEVISCAMKGDLDLVVLHQNLSLPATGQSFSLRSSVEQLNFKDDCRMQDDSLLGCSLSSIEVSQESISDRQTCWCRQKFTDTKRIQQLEHENTKLRSLLEQLLTESKHQMEEMNRHQIEIECLREQRAMLLEGPLHKFPNGHRLKDCFGEELETIGEHEPLRMFIVNGKFRFEEMRKWKRYGEKDRKSSVRRYHM
ncbi:uncharacterized protein LOC134285301 isoform X2 [Aedes albopictus]|uniref:Uncharacterized protein n=1 Tax=Aedes albopictus TaxID=7160 RepID=A0ABM1XSN9_AEDAL